jgi:small-conductance mechanosensitive channel
MRVPALRQSSTMSAFVSLSIEASSVDAPFLAVMSRLVFLALLIAAGVAASWLFWRMGRVRSFGDLHPWLPVFHAGIWGLIVFFVLRASFPEATGVRPYTRMGLFALLAIIALPWLRNVFHGLVFALERRYRIGDHLRVGALEGRVVALGVRAVTLRAADGTEAAVPYSNFAVENVVRLNLDARDTPCEIEVKLPEHVPIDRAIQHARTAATLTPFASPRCPPDVFIVPDRDDLDAIKLRIRGFVFDREHEQRYTSEVVARLSAALRSERERAMGLAGKARIDGPTPSRA